MSAKKCIIMILNVSELAYLLEPGPAPQAVGPKQSQSTQAMYIGTNTKH